MEKFDRIALGTDEACRKAVKAGGDVLADALSAAAPVRTGGLARSIKAKPKPYNAADGYSCEVAPQGNDPKTGEPYAKIGNVLEYGRSYGNTKKDGVGWFNPTVKSVEAEVIAAMTEELRKNEGGG